MLSDALEVEERVGALNSAAIAVAVEDLSKRYHVYDRPYYRLFQSLLRHRRTLYREFWALRNIKFTISRGDSIGIVGRNGSGKSTLLQIIAGTLSPSSGETVVKGRIAALLELGGDFNPQFTGRENVYLNGAILGFSKREVDDRFESIAAFADIGSFIDQPVSVLSNGLILRLAFSVATCFEPDVLIVDEALAVGDAPFQAKCFARMRHMLENDVTVLFASHSLGTVRAFCNKAAYLRDGRLLAFGDVNEVTRQYELDCMRAQGVGIDPENKETPYQSNNEVTPQSEKLLDACDHVIVEDLVRNSANFAALSNGQRTGTGAAQIEAAGFFTRDGSPLSVVSHDQRIVVAALIRAYSDIEHDVHFAMRVKTVEGTERLVVRDSAFCDPFVLPFGERALAKMEFTLPVSAGDYYAELGLLLFPKGTKYQDQHFNFSAAEIADLIERVVFVQVRPFAWHPIMAPVLAESILRLQRIT